MNIRICSIIIGTGEYKPAKSFQKKRVWHCLIRALYSQKTVLGTLGGAIKTPGEARHKFLLVAVVKALYQYAAFKRCECRKVKNGDNSFFMEKFLAPEFEEIKA